MKKATGGLHSHIDYTSFVGVGAVGLVIPLSCVFAGLSVLVDRHTGAQEFGRVRQVSTRVVTYGRANRLSARLFQRSQHTRGSERWNARVDSRVTANTKHSSSTSLADLIKE